MSGEIGGEDRRVGDADVRQAVHLQVRIDDTTRFEGKHRACRRWVVLRADDVDQPLVPVVVGLHARARRGLVAHHAA